MGVEAFLNWRRELDAIQQEMDRLITQGLPASNEERQVRNTQFAALVERREAAARILLQDDRERRRGKSPKAKLSSGDHSVAAPGGAESHGPAEAFVCVPEETTQGEAEHAASPRPTAGAETATDASDAAITSADTSPAEAVSAPADSAKPQTGPEVSALAEPSNVGGAVAATPPDAESLALERPPSAAAPADRAEAQSHAVAPAVVDTVAPGAGDDMAGLTGHPDHMPETVRSAELEVMPEAPVGGAPHPLIPGLLELGTELRPNRANPTDLECPTTDASAAACEAVLSPDLHAKCGSADAPAPVIDEVAARFDAAAPASTPALPRATVPEIAGIPELASDFSDAAGPNNHPASAQPCDDAGVGTVSHVVGTIVSAGDATAAVSEAATPSAPPAEELKSDDLLRKLLRHLQVGR